MDTSEFHRLVAPDLGHLNELIRGLSSVFDGVVVPPAVHDGLQDVVQRAAQASAVHVDLAPVLSGAVAAVEQAWSDAGIAPALAQQSMAALEAAGISTAIADTIDLSWLQGDLSRIVDAALPHDWFENQVRGLYTSGLLDDLDECPVADTDEEIPEDTAAALEASAAAFQEQVVYLPFAEQKKLFVSFVCAIAISLAAILVVAVQDEGKSRDVLGAVSDITGIVATAAPAAMMAWDRRSRRTPEGEGEGDS
jgi:hypothetical protein